MCLFYWTQFDIRPEKCKFYSEYINNQASGDELIKALFVLLSEQNAGINSQFYRPYQNYY